MPPTAAMANITDHNQPLASNIVPACPTGLSITREDFMADDFSVDSFLARWHAKSTASPVARASNNGYRSLETLRDDLGIYLKVLRSSMIELINEDYADFVNLSTNLVGLDEQIQNLERPLMDFGAKVEEAKAEVESTIRQMNESLVKREIIASKKMALQNLEHIAVTLAKVERLLGPKSLASGGEQQQLSGDLVERVAAEINHLNFCLSKCETSTASTETFVNELRPRISAVVDRLHASLENQLLDAIATRNVEVLKRCLRVFATVDRAREAERLVRVSVVRPYLEETITEKALLEDPQALRGIFLKVMKIIPTKLSDLIQLTVTHGTKKHHYAKDYNILTNTMWPELIEQIDDNLSIIFNAGNPKKFFENYSASQELLDSFEQELGLLSAVEHFRESDAYKTFIGRWNLPVYFQIRFQEIALPVEMAMTAMFNPSAQAQETSVRFRLESTFTVLLAILKCWDRNGVYLDALSHRFWKLTLQILSRFSTGVAAAPDLPVMAPAAPDAVDAKKKYKDQHLHTSSTSKDLAPKRSSSPVAFLRGHFRSSSDQGSIPPPNGEAPVPLEGPVISETFRSRPKELMMLWLDVSYFIEHLKSVVFVNTILPVLGDFGRDQTELLTGSLDESCSRMRDQLPVISAIIVGHVVDKSVPHLRQVLDIPRLFRRTNREVPSKPCAYVTAVLATISEFQKEHAARTSCAIGSAAMHQWLLQIYEAVVKQYLMNVSEVLAAVQKMEESLKRLKRVRDPKSSLVSTPSSSALDDDAKSAGSISDDDKIRLQLFVDVSHFLEKMAGESLVRKDEITDAAELEEVVSEATRSFQGQLLKV